MPQNIRKIVSIVGARPQFIKAFALSRAFAESDDFEEIILHTGQHFDERMSDVFFEELSIPRPRHHFEFHGLSHGAMTGRMLEAIENVLMRERPDAVVVFGDTNSTLAGALAAAKLSIPVAHVEAGLRAFNRSMPEEINRVATDYMSDLLLCPTHTAVTNLAHEGVTRSVHHVGDLMYDSTLLALPIAERISPILQTLRLAPKTYGIATIHRAANTDDETALRSVFDFIAAESQNRTIVFPIHPRTAAAARAMGIDPAKTGARIVEPLGFLDMCLLLHHAEILLTDSGGMQKEAYFHRVPCVTLRDETEWVETIRCGWNRLWTVATFAPQCEIADYGNGNTAGQIVALLRQKLG